MKVVAGPWVGEFGWELFCWQAYIRAMSKVFNFTDVVCVTRPGRELLYEDFARVKVLKDIPNHGSDMHSCRGYSFKKFIDSYSKEYPDYELILPFNCWYHGKSVSINGQQVTAEFNALGQHTKNSEYPVILHARSREHRSSDNWSRKNWNVLVSKLSREGIPFAFIGSKEESLFIDGGADLRGMPLCDVVGYLAGAKCVVGPSSGPMHLATLCKCPQVVWSGNDSNEIRYKQEWNPFETPVAYLGNEYGGWNPNPETVYRKIIELLC